MLIGIFRFACAFMAFVFVMITIALVILNAPREEILLTIITTNTFLIVAKVYGLDC